VPKIRGFSRERQLLAAGSHPNPIGKLCVAISCAQAFAGGAGAKSTPQTGLRHISNRSRACRNGNWKMASRDWLDKATSPHLKFQNLPARTRGNVGGSHTRGKSIVETALAGWGGRIRTSAWRNQNPTSSLLKSTGIPKKSGNLPSGISIGCACGRNDLTQPQRSLRRTRT
jgi:hypothetical protein